MKKTLILLSALLAFPLAAQAHSTLEASTPAEGAVITEPLEQIALDFSANIEQGSTMALSVDGTAVDFSEVAVMDDQLIGTPAEELEDGSYVVDYEVLSEDGHPIEGSLAFELQAGEEETASEESDEAAAAEEEPAADEAEAEESEQTEASDMEQASSGEPEAPSEDAGSSLTLIIAGIAIILLIGAVVLMRRKR
ncbi:copper resistance protein CopC [Planococcus maritimus]|uniref:Copper resistance protein CopC n=1 Tax=Planococcus maritimus TaxID=192421 RepID=A0A7D7MH61_PLAMR|nr:copper resistance CopC family protein [Planococcus maritimus]QMT18010.1 copper resistance protein CopC [Planococcus maritimus]